MKPYSVGDAQYALRYTETDYLLSCSGIQIAKHYANNIVFISSFGGYPIRNESERFGGS
jgi:hypothetical protein